MASKRVDLKAILDCPRCKRNLMVTTIIAIQAREGVTTTREQAEQAYDRIQLERLKD